MRNKYSGVKIFRYRRRAASLVRSLGKLRFSEQTRDVQNSWHNWDKLGFTVSSLPRLEETWLIEE